MTCWIISNDDSLSSMYVTTSTVTYHPANVYLRRRQWRNGLGGLVSDPWAE